MKGKRFTCQAGGSRVSCEPIPEMSQPCVIALGMCMGGAVAECSTGELVLVPTSEAASGLDILRSSEAKPRTVQAFLLLGEDVLAELKCTCEAGHPSEACRSCK